MNCSPSRTRRRSEVGASSPPSPSRWPADTRLLPYLPAAVATLRQIRLRNPATILVCRLLITGSIRAADSEPTDTAQTVSHRWVPSGRLAGWCRAYANSVSGKSDARKFFADEVLDPSDPHVRESEAFPRLTADQVERVSSFGVVQRLPRGTVLFAPGDRTIDFFVILDGSIEAYVSRGTAQQVVHVYGQQQFTGELNLFNDRATLVGARMGGDGRVARLNGAQFRRLLAAEPDIANVVMRAFILRRERIIVLGHTGVTIIAPRHSAKLLHLQGFLTRNRQPYLLADPEVEAEAAAQLSELGYVIDDTPVVVCGDDRALVCPTPRELGDRLGIAEPLDPQHVADVVVVGAGPAGLAAAVYSASEGLDTVVLEADAPGGQASTSSRIENYLGFPIGISGRDLAHRAQVQAQKFGARIIVPRTVVRLVTDSRPYILELDDGTQVRAHTVVVATGARYRSLPWPISSGSKAVGSTTPPPRSNRSCVKATTRPSLAGATPPGRPRSSCHVSPSMCTSWCAATDWRPPCPTTSSVVSRRRPNASPCIRTPRSPR